MKLFKLSLFFTLMATFVSANENGFPLGITGSSLASEYIDGEDIKITISFENQTNTSLTVVETMVFYNLDIQAIAAGESSVEKSNRPYVMAEVLPRRLVKKTINPVESVVFTNSLKEVMPAGLSPGEYKIHARYKGHYKPVDGEWIPVSVNITPFSLVIKKPDDDTGAYSLYAEAQKKEREKAYKAASLLYGQAIDKKPDGKWVPYLYYEYARCLKQSGQDKECIDAYKMVYTLFPDSRWAKEAEQEIKRIDLRRDRREEHDAYLKRMHAVFNDPAQEDAAKAYEAILNETDILKKIVMLREFISDFPDSFLVQEALFEEADLCQNGTRLLETYSKQCVEDLKRKCPDSYRTKMLKE